MNEKYVFQCRYWNYFTSKNTSYLLDQQSIFDSLRLSLSRLGDVEELGQALDDGLDIHVHQRHSIVRILLHDRHQRQVPIHLPQHDGLITVMQHKTALRRQAPDLVFQLRIPRLALQPLAPVIAALPRPVDLGDIDNDIDVVGADFVAGHVGGRAVGRDVDFGHDVEEIGLLEAAGSAQVGEHGLEGSEARDELLDDFAKGLEDGVVVDGGEVEGDGGVFEAVV